MRKKFHISYVQCPAAHVGNSWEFKVETPFIEVRKSLNNNWATPHMMICHWLKCAHIAIVDVLTKVTDVSNQRTALSPTAND
jgi:hypothetical protein